MHRTIVDTFDLLFPITIKVLYMSIIFRICRDKDIENGTDP